VAHQEGDDADHGEAFLKYTSITLYHRRHLNHPRADMRTPRHTTHGISSSCIVGVGRRVANHMCQPAPAHTTVDAARQPHALLRCIMPNGQDSTYDEPLCVTSRLGTSQVSTLVRRRPKTALTCPTVCRQSSDPASPSTGTHTGRSASRALSAPHARNRSVRRKEWRAAQRRGPPTSVTSARARSASHRAMRLRLAWVTARRRIGDRPGDVLALGASIECELRPRAPCSPPALGAWRPPCPSRCSRRPRRCPRPC